MEERVRQVQKEICRKKHFPSHHRISHCTHAKDRKRKKERNRKRQKQEVIRIKMKKERETKTERKKIRRQED